MERDDVGVSLDDDRPILLRDRRSSPVEPVDERALLEQLGLLRVDVLPPDGIVVREPAGAESEHPPARVGEREDQAGAERVVAAAVHEAGRAELLARVALLAGLPRDDVTAGGEPEAELAADPVVEVSTCKVVADRLPRRRLPEVALVEARGVLEQGQQPLTPAPVALVVVRALRVLELDAIPVGQHLDRLDEVEPLRLLHEREHVAALLAAEAVVGLPLRADGEARRPLVVERAAARVARADLAQLDARTDDLDDVRRRPDLVDRGVADQRHASAKRSVIPAT